MPASAGSKLRYIPADQVEAAGQAFQDMTVIEEHTSSRLGHVDGFVLDPAAKRAYFVVIDSGGWFRSRRFMLPIRHARLERGALRVDVPKDDLSRYPQYGRVRVAAWSAAEMRAFERDTASAYESSADDVEGYESLEHDAEPERWVGEADDARGSRGHA